MRIAFYPINAGGVFHGAKRRCISLADGLVELGHDVYIILTPGHDPKNFVSNMPHKVKILSSEEAQNTSWDIFSTHGHSPRLKSEGSLRHFSYIGKILTVRAEKVFWLQGGMGSPFPPRLNVFPKLNNYILALQDASRFAPLFPLLSSEVLKRTIILKCGISSYFKPIIRSTNRPLVVGFFRSRVKQGLPIICKMLKAVSKETKDWSILCFGFKKLEKELGNKIHGIKFEYRHSLTEEQLVKTYQEIDIFVAAEPQAGWSHTAAESMACGCATVCGWCGTSLFAKHEETTLVVNTLDASSVTQGVLRLLKDEKLREKLSRNGPALASTLTWRAAAQHCLDSIDKPGDFSKFKPYLDRFPKLANTHWWFNKSINWWDGRIALKLDTQLVKKTKEVLLDEKIKSVLEVGCGTAGLKQLFDFCDKYYGVDIARQAINSAIKRHKGCKFLCGDFRKIDLPIVDACISFDVFDHLDHFDVGLKKLFSISKLVLITFFHQLVEDGGRIKKIEKNCYDNIYSKADIERFCKECNWSVEFFDGVRKKGGIVSTLGVFRRS